VYAGPGLPDTVEFAAGYAPGLAVADTSRFYEAGHGGSVYGGLVLGRRSGIVAALSASAFFTHASGLSADGDLMVVPVAVSVRLRSLPSPVGAYATVGAGAALIQLKNPILGTFTKFAPHATGGLGVKVALTNWVGLNAGVTVDAIFEGSTILTQIVPNISVYMGF
jgi:hypothetical protein